MNAKPSPEKSILDRFRAFRALVRFPHFRPVPAAVSSLTFVLVCLTSLGSLKGGRGRDFQQFETGQVADRDVVAEDDVSYVDEDATKLRLEAQERLVPAVFRFSPAVEKDAVASWKDFVDFTENLFGEGISAEAFKLRIQAEYPAEFSNHVLDVYYADPDRATYGETGATVLGNILGRGVFSLPHEGLERYNPDVAEVLLAESNSRNEWERISYKNIITRENVAAAAEEEAANFANRSAFTGFSSMYPLTLKNSPTPRIIRE
jgi:hypothetical protein